MTLPPRNPDRGIRKLRRKAQQALLNRTLVGHIWQTLDRPPSEHWRALIADRLAPEKRGMSGWAYSVTSILVLTFGAAVLISGTLWAAFMAYRVARVVGRESGGGKMDALGVTPSGTEGVLWAICGTTLHDDIGYEHFRGVAQLVVTVALVPLVAFTLLSGLTLLAGQSDALSLSVLDAFLWFTTLLVFLPLDTFYSIPLGALVGMLTGWRQSSDNGWLALGLVLLLQVGGYVVALLAGFVILPVFLGDWNGASALGHLLLPLLTALVFWLARAVTLTVLWTAAQQSDLALTLEQG